MSTELEVKEKIVHIINLEISRTLMVEDKTFMLNAPNKFTTLRNGKWGSKTFIGENEFTLINTYIGKTGNIICVFVELGNWEKYQDTPSLAGNTIRQIEMRDDVAKEYLTDFDKLLQSAWMHREDEIVAEVRNEVKKMEEAAIFNPFDNPIFGSW